MFQGGSGIGATNEKRQVLVLQGGLGIEVTNGKNKADFSVPRRVKE